MTALSMDGLLNDLTTKLETLIEDCQKHVDAVEKELRVAKVMPMPILLERIRTLMRGELQHEPARRLYKGRTISFERGHDYSGAQTANFLLSSIYLLLDDGGDRVVPINVSSRTACEFKGEMKSVHDHTVEAIKRAKEASFDGSIPKFRAVLLELEQHYIPSEFFSSQPVKLNGFIRDLCNLLIRTPDQLFASSPDVVDFYTRYSRTCLLELKERFYFSQGDIRAFYKDTDLARSLAGSIVQSLLSPRMGLRKQAASSEYAPVRDKNLLNQRVFIPGGHSSRMIVGDISSFTASNINSWVAILVMLLQIDSDELNLGDPFIITVQGEPLEVTLKEVIGVYLYTIVYSEGRAGDRTFHVTGGCLGVNGNMTSTMLAFTLLMDYFHRTGRVDITRLIQLGGDDFCVIITGQQQGVGREVERLRRLITSYCGMLKDFRVVNLAVTMDNSYDVCLFCKRHVDLFVEWYPDYKIVTVRSRPTIPIPSHCFTTPKHSTDRGIIDHFNELIAAQQNAIGDMLGGPQVISTFVHVAGVVLKLWPNPHLLSLGSKAVCRESFIEHEGSLITPAALAKVLSFENFVMSNGEICGYSYYAKLNLASSKECVTLSRALIETNEIRKVWTTQSEKRNMDVTKIPFQFTTSANNDQITHFVELLSRTREALMLYG